jgi:hypothetical protein
MDEHDILRHLLQVEADAAALVDDAQAEADRRLAEGEKRNRSLYDERYGRETGELEAGYGKEIAGVKEDYQKRLDAYRESLNAITVHRDRFNALADNLFMKVC